MVPRRSILRTGLACVLVLLAASVAWAAQKLPQNLAAKATVGASSEYSNQYLAKFAVDGKVPPAGSQADVSKAWAVQGKTAADKGEFTLGWKQPVTVTEIVYYGRTAWLMGECWKTYEVYADGAAEPVRFRWGSRTFNVDAINGRWIDRGGDGYSLHYSVQVGDETYYVHFASQDVQWWLDRVVVG